MTNEWEMVSAAIQRRAGLMEALAAEDTNAYRLFHGAVEQFPGLCIDRYGDLVLVQTFRAPLEPAQLDTLDEVLRDALPFAFEFVYNHRKKKPDEPFSVWHTPVPSALEPRTIKELGVSYAIQARHRGIDPWLFLDLRVGREWMLKQSEGKEVLNLFAYTCGVGICAGVAGAKEVWNVDFAASSLEVGAQNVALNALPAKSCRMVKEDVIPVLRQLAGLPVKGRGRRRDFLRVAPRQFDIVFLDPPAWARSPFGAVDLVRDYQSLFKPALLAAKPGGHVIATNNVHRVGWQEWSASLLRCAEKAGRPIKSLEPLIPYADFPSSDAQHPLKIAVCEMS